MVSATENQRGSFFFKKKGGKPRVLVFYIKNLTLKNINGFKNNSEFAKKIMDLKKMFVVLEKECHIFKNS